MRNVGLGRESSLCYLCTTSPLSPATTSYIAFPSQIAPGVDACQLASGFASKPLLSPLSTSILLDLSLLILSLTSSQALNPQLNRRGAPPCFLAALPSPRAASYPPPPFNGLWSGKRLRAFQTQIYHGLDQLGTMCFQSHHDYQTVSLFCE